MILPSTLDTNRWDLRIARGHWAVPAAALGSGPGNAMTGPLFALGWHRRAQIPCQGGCGVATVYVREDRAHEKRAAIAAELARWFGVETPGTRDVSGAVARVAAGCWAVPAAGFDDELPRKNRVSALAAAGWVSRGQFVWQSRNVSVFIRVERMSARAAEIRAELDRWAALPVDALA